MLDGYGTADGETRALDELMARLDLTIRKTRVSHVPAYIRKPGGAPSTA